MSRTPNLTSAQQELLVKNNNDGSFSNNSFMRDPSTISTNDIRFPKLLEKGGQVEEQTLMQVEFVNEKLLRKAHRSELATKRTFLTRVWQTALVTGIFLFVLGGCIGGLVYWIKLPKVLTTPYLLYGETCYMNSRSCDATRMLWCPAGICICTGDFQWNATAQNCSCGKYQKWTGFRCQDYGYYGDPCNSSPCQPTLTCSIVVNQTYTTGQDICVCDNETYLYTNGGVNQGKCVTKLTYGQTCKTNLDCQNWLGLSCSAASPNPECLCSSSAYWDGTTCRQNAFGWEPCNGTVQCDATRGLTCVSNICQCINPNYFWDNVTTLWCQQKRTYSIACQYNFQCNTTVNLSCPSNSTGCNCPLTSYSGICDCQAGEFWDGQRCIGQHTFNGTCPGQYACSTNLLCFLGHCICPGNMIWNATLPAACQCSNGTTWNTMTNLCT